MLFVVDAKSWEVTPVGWFAGSMFAGNILSKKSQIQEPNHIFETNHKVLVKTLGENQPY